MSIQSEIARITQGVGNQTELIAQITAALEGKTAGGGGDGGDEYIFEQAFYTPAETITLSSKEELEVCSTTVTKPYVIMFSRMNSASQYAPDYVAHSMNEVAMISGVENKEMVLNKDGASVVSHVSHNSSTNFATKKVTHYESNQDVLNSSANSSSYTLRIAEGKMYLHSGGTVVLSAGATFMATIVGV